VRGVAGAGSTDKGGVGTARLDGNDLVARAGQNVREEASAAGSRWKDEGRPILDGDVAADKRTPEVVDEPSISEATLSELQRSEGKIGGVVVGRDMGSRVKSGGVVEAVEVGGGISEGEEVGGGGSDSRGGCKDRRSVPTEQVVESQRIGTVPRAAVGDGDGRELEAPSPSKVLGRRGEGGLGSYRECLCKAGGKRRDVVVARVASAVAQAERRAGSDGCYLNQEHVLEREGRAGGRSGTAGAELRAARHGVGKRGGAFDEMSDINLAMDDDAVGVALVGARPLVVAGGSDEPPARDGELHTIGAGSQTPPATAGWDAAENREDTGSGRIEVEGSRTRQASNAEGGVGAK